MNFSCCTRYNKDRDSCNIATQLTADKLCCATKFGLFSYTLLLIVIFCFEENLSIISLYIKLYEMFRGGGVFVETSIHPLGRGGGGGQLRESAPWTMKERSST